MSSNRKNNEDKKSENSKKSSNNNSTISMTDNGQRIIIGNVNNTSILYDYDSTTKIWYQNSTINANNNYINNTKISSDGTNIIFTLLNSQNHGTINIQTTTINQPKYISKSFLFFIRKNDELYGQ